MGKPVADLTTKATLSVSALNATIWSLDLNTCTDSKRMSIFRHIIAHIDYPHQKLVLICNTCRALARYKVTLAL